jgi:hypothetical protein
MKTGHIEAFILEEPGNNRRVYPSAQRYYNPLFTHI